MYLYLAQHAEARPKEEDPERHLTENGINSAVMISSYISQNVNIQLYSIVHSGKTRALETAKILAEKFDPVRGIEEGKELSPNSTPWGWVEKLSQMEQNIMIVGHLPHLQRLSSLLLCQDEHKKIMIFLKGCVFCLQRDESGIWVIRWMLTPDIIPA